MVRFSGHITALLKTLSMPSADPQYIIAIGASAGGMEEINSFFDHTPLDGVSYVIVQHLSADFKSRMVELLSRHSKLVVIEAESGMNVKSNQVYLIPNDKFMTIQDNRLYLTGKEHMQGPHLTINTFFNSLAADSGKKAIGIILSGLGADGTEGIRAIKKAGGMIIARNPETTEFGSMPASAIATGMVDFVLEPELMPDAIEDYVQYAGELVAEDDADDKHITAIIDFIKEKLPLDFSDYKLTTLLRRTKRRAGYNNFDTLEKYLAFLKKTPEEVEALAKDFLISVTSFFRDSEAFAIIENKILPDLLAKLTPGEELKLWVAGCATGEEAYTMAIIIAEQLKGDFKDTVVKLFATDIDSAAMEHAGKGIYQGGITKDISPDRLEKYFIKEGDSYRVAPVIRRMVIFAQHDLVKNPPYCNMHFISCRNLLIYMTPVLQKKIFTMLLFGLKVGGCLFLGASENPIPILGSLEVVDKKWRLYKSVKSKREVSFDVFSLPELLDIKRNASPAVTLNSTNHTLAEAMNTALAKEREYLAICVDENHQVLKSFGDTGKYLIQQSFNTNLDQLLQKPLAIAFHTLSKDALRTNTVAAASGIKIKNGEKAILISLSVTPLIKKKGEQTLLMVTFSEDKVGRTILAESNLFDEQVYYDRYTANLEEELKDLRGKLHTAYERLDASNENMQSFNEELISANEEMQSTNEEMQSVNEELHTINADYQLKNKELSEVNDDLNNYFRSNLNGQLFVNNELQLMRFSPGAVKQINLMESDIGRPLSHISTNIKLETIIEDIRQVIAEGNAITKEIETNSGQWYQIMTMPYVQQAEHRNTGAIITFNDITELKNTQLELHSKNKSLLRINADLDHFIHAASHDLLAPLGNIETSINMMNRIALSDEKLLDFLNMINKSIKTYRSLITDIAVIAKVEGDMVKMESVHVDDLIDNITWSLEDKIDQSGAVIIRDIQVDKLLFSRKNLRSILFNLVSNAIKFRRDESPVIHIQTVSKGGDIVLTVSDNGKGIPKNGLNKIFDMYGRLHQDIEGSGIGLYLAKKIVNAAGGNIIVESEPGEGSKFMIYFRDSPEH